MVYYDPGGCSECNYVISCGTLPKSGESRLQVTRIRDSRFGATSQFNVCMYVCMGGGNLTWSGISYGFGMYARDFTGINFSKFYNSLITIISV